MNGPTIPCFLFRPRPLGAGAYMDDETVKRVGENEAIFRLANEQRGLLADEAELGEVPVVCECGHSWCSEIISVTPQEYQRVRSRPDQFFVFPGHEIEEGEFVAAVGRGVQAQKQYRIVEKRAGLPAEVAEATDPRG